jgi:predicted Zn-dependent protease
VNRRDVLGTLGVASAGTLLWAFGCRTAAPVVQEIATSGGEVRTWLHDAVALLAAAGLEAPRALAVIRKRTTAASDVLGRGVSRDRCEGAVVSARDRDGTRREQVTSDLSGPGVVAAAKALIARDLRPGKLAFGEPKIWVAEYVEPEEEKLLERAEAIGAGDKELTSRIVYQANVLDVDDATTWAVTTGRDLEQRLVRIRLAATRVAWNGTRPVTAEVSRAWTGVLGDHALAGADVSAASAAAQTLATSGAFDEGEYAVGLEPDVVARLADSATRGLLTSAAMRRPEVARRLAVGARVAGPMFTLVDDPRTQGAYGGYHFDDEGELAAAVTLVDQGVIAGRLDERRRPGHLGQLEAMASHLRLATGTADAERILDDGFILEGASEAIVDPASDRVVISVARAREMRGGNRTGRVFADVELVGELAPLLASVSAVSSVATPVSFRDEVDGRPRWRSMDAPWLRAHGRLRARRGGA